MRDDFDYHSMERPELRSHLERVAKEVATWSHATYQARAEEHRYYIDGYKNSTARAVTERKMEAEIHSDFEHRQALDAESNLLFWTAIRDLIVVLLT
jgi:uncharacterized Rossmann fold enzyme